MKKTPHQAFIEELHKQINSNDFYHENPSNNHTDSSNQSTYEEDIRIELEKKFDELFGNCSEDE